MSFFLFGANFFCGCQLLSLYGFDISNKNQCIWLIQCAVLAHIIYSQFQFDRLPWFDVLWMLHTHNDNMCVTWKTKTGHWEALGHLWFRMLLMGLFFLSSECCFSFHQYKYLLIHTFSIIGKSSTHFQWERCCKESLSVNTLRSVRNTHNHIHTLLELVAQN